MIDLKTLKFNIENKTVLPSIIVFKYKSENSKFLALQYSLELAHIFNKSVNYTDKLVIYNNNLFDSQESDYFNIYICDDLKIDIVSNIDYTTVITKTVSSNVDENYIVNIPDLENWQIKDYLYSNLEVDKKYLDFLCEVYKYNLFKLDLEVKRFKYFSGDDLNKLFKDFVNEGGYSHINTNTIFDFSNSIVKKDYQTVSNIYSRLDSIDIDPLGLTTVLINNFHDIITIQLASNPSPETCNMPANKFWAIRKNNCNIWTKEELIKNYKFLLDIDKQIKTGNLTNDRILIDYILVNIL